MFRDRTRKGRGRLIKPPALRITVILNRLTGAGVQRMRMNIVEELVERGYMVDLVVGKNFGALSDSVPKGVTLYEVAANGSLWFFFGLLRYCWKRQPTHFLTSNEDISIITIVVNWLVRSPAVVLVSAHNSLTGMKREGGRLNRWKWRVLLWLMPLIYRKAGVIVAVSHGLATELNKVARIPEEAIRVINNPVIGKRFEGLSVRPIPRDLRALMDVPVVGYFGRLHPQKQVDKLLEAFARVRGKRQCRLLLVGEGDEASKMRDLAADLGVVSDVVFYGFSHNPYPIMKTCDVIVLPSSYEGFGNVLVEGLACGIQVISTDCRYGPAEILEEGRWGQLVPVDNTEKLEVAIHRSLNKEFWIEPVALKARGMQFSATKATNEYLLALGLPQVCRER